MMFTNEQNSLLTFLLAGSGLRNAGRSVRRKDCTLTTVDHNTPTEPRQGYDMSNMAENGFIKEPDSLNQVIDMCPHNHPLVS